MDKIRKIGAKKTPEENMARAIPGKDRIWLAKVSEHKEEGEKPRNTAFKRRVFVRNLSVILSETTTGVYSVTLDRNDVCHVVYKGGYRDQIDVKGLAYIDIIRKVIERL